MEKARDAKEQNDESQEPADRPVPLHPLGRKRPGQCAKILHYQGVLTDTAGNPIHCLADGTCADPYAMTFRLYDQADGGTLLFEQPETAVSIVNGVFEVTLGTPTNPIELSVVESGNV